MVYGKCGIRSRKILSIGSARTVCARRSTYNFITIIFKFRVFHLKILIFLTIKIPKLNLNFFKILPKIRGVESKLCIDTKFKPSHSNFGLDLCQSSNRDISGEQKFELSWRSDIRPKSRNVCWDVSQSNDGTPVILFECHGYRGNQEFRYNLV